MIKIFLICILTLVCFVHKDISAQVLTTQYQRHHLLVLIDRSQSMRNSLCSNNNLSALILTDLKSMLFQKGLVISDRQLLENGDYLSILSFGLDADAKSFDQFIPNDFGIRMEPISEQNADRTLQQIMEQIERIGCGNFLNKSYGAYTVAVPATLNLFRGKDKLVSRTFIITITDGQFNATGQQPRLELGTIKTQIKGLKGIDIDIEKPLSMSTGLFESYGLVQGTLEQYGKPNPKIRSVIKGKARMQLHELVPLQRPLAIEAFLRADRAILQFCQPSFWERNVYRADLNLLYSVSENLNRFYQIDSMSACLTQRDEVIWQKSYSKIESDIPLRIEIPSDRFDSTLKFDLKYWVKFTDNAYGMHTLSPDGHELQGAEGLKRSIPIDMQITRDKTWFFYPVILGIMLFFSILLYLLKKKHKV